ncbi:MAG: Mu-like prophage protein [Devosia sp.]|uniref:phage protease n=1 Tax=Devosia sp. TaxID=1871048 RepID=UPI0026257165|nr:phage protease [Devosia sp.]MDB5586210.1 Mu-like prophage protein [Devosia sp.]
MELSVNHQQIALCAEVTPAGLVALCAALGLPGDSAAAPDWVHLLPAGQIRTGDGRGPYQVRDVAALMAKSLQAGERLVIDENHSTDLAAPKGMPAPAMGWIVELQSRADGVWGKAEWTDEGRRLVAGRAYRGLSPVILHDKAGTIDAVLRASLVNKPNFKGLTALHSETTDMDLLAKLLTALKLPTETSEDTLLTAITTLHSQQANHQVALQAQLMPIAKVAGLPEGAKAEAILAAVTQLAAGGGDAKTIVALQNELTEVTNTLNGLVEDGTKKTAAAFVDKAIADRRVGVSSQRDRFITLHMADPANAEAIINGLPMLGRSNTLATPPGKDAQGKRVLASRGMLASLASESGLLVWFTGSIWATAISEATFVAETAAFTIGPTHYSNTVRLATASAVAVTLPANAPVGANFSLLQVSTGAAAFAAASGASLHHELNHAQSFGRWSFCGAVVEANAGGTAASWVLYGSTKP